MKSVTTQIRFFIYIDERNTVNKYTDEDIKRRIAKGVTKNNDRNAMYWSLMDGIAEDIKLKA